MMSSFKYITDNSVIYINTDLDLDTAHRSSPMPKMVQSSTPKKPTNSQLQSYTR